MRATNGPINIHLSRFLRKIIELSTVCMSILVEYRADIRITLLPLTQAYHICIIIQ